MFKIDAHNHPDYYGRNPEQFVKNMDAVGIAKTILLSWEAPLDEISATYFPIIPTPMRSDVTIPFSTCYEYWKAYPDRFLLGYAPDPRQPGAIARMKSAIRGYRVQICGEVKFRMMYDNPDAVDLFRFCGENGVPVLLHFDYPEAQLSGCVADYPRRHWWYGGSIETLEHLLKLCPETNFLGHAPGFWCHISNDDKGLTQAYPTGEVIPGGMIERLLDKYPNLYCDCSAGSALNALGRDPDYTARLMKAHPDRFIYARDYFDNKLSPFIDSLGLSEEILEGFYHGNLEKILPPVYEPPVMPD